MKKRFVIFFFLVTGTLSAQVVSFCSPKGWVRNCFRLREDNVFTYEFHSCLGVNYGIGVYKRMRNKYVLTFSPVSPKINKRNEKVLPGKVRISCRDTILNSAAEMIQLRYKGQVVYTDSTGIIEFDYSGGDIAIYRFLKEENVTIRPEQDHTNNYVVTWNYYGVDYRGVIEMKKRFGNRYRSNEIWYGENGTQNKHSFIYKRRVPVVSICF